MKKFLQVEVEVTDEKQFAELKKTMDNYGFRFGAAKEIDDGMTGKSPLAGPYIKKMVYKRNANPFS